MQIKLIILIALFSVKSFADLKIAIIDDFSSLNSHGNKIASIVQRNNKKSNLLKLNIDNYYESLREAIDKNVDVVNISSGRDFYDQTEYKLLKELVDKNVIIIVAAGNDGKRLGLNSKVYPCSYNLDIICVGSSIKDQKINNNSNYGRGVSFFTDGSFLKENATSYAAPKIALLALKFKAMGYRDYNFKDILYNSSIDVKHRGESVSIVSKELFEKELYFVYNNKIR